ncbi:hypothetical protein ACI8AC_06570 [Geodermatophilus sp. SYSU D00758]
MAVTPLTTAQQRAVEELVAARRLERVPVDEQRCAAFLGQAETALSDPPNVTHAQNRYNLAYDATHDVGEAMLAAYGYRTRHGPGQHDALGRFLAAVFDTPPENAASRHVDQMRRERNRQRCNAQPITTAAARAATDAASTLFHAGRSRTRTGG